MTHAHYTNTHHKDCENDKKNRCADALHKHASAALGNFVLPKMWCCKQSCKQTVQRTKRTAVATFSKLQTNSAGNQAHSAATLSDLSALCFFRSDSNCFFKTKSALIADSNLGISSQQPQLHPQIFIRIRTIAHENVKDFLRASGFCIFHKLLVIFLGILLLQLQD